MKSTFTLEVDTFDIEMDIGVYPGGEVYVKIPPETFSIGVESYVLTAQLRCAEGIQVIAQVKAIMDNCARRAQSSLYLGYVAYSRQDRITVEGEANTLKVFAKQINAQNFDTIITVDNHSDVATALINNCINATKGMIFAVESQSKRPFFDEYDVFVAPDYGAAKEVQALATLYNKKFVQGFKKRDTATGKLTGFGHYAAEDSLEGERILIIDDLCDGGGTFLGLLESLHKQHALFEVGLYVTHGIFSKGTDLLTEAFTKVYTTDTLIECVGSAEEAGLVVIELYTN